MLLTTATTADQQAILRYDFVSVPTITAGNVNNEMSITIPIACIENTSVSAVMIAMLYAITPV